MIPAELVEATGIETVLLLPSYLNITIVMPLGFEVLNCISFITSFTSSSSTLLSTSPTSALLLSRLFIYVLV
jgi:hypothetical protein|nr:MAG TPA: hypothetical protein [Bacteriophage sp.]